MLPEGIQVCFPVDFHENLRVPPTATFAYRLLVGLIFQDHGGLHNPFIFPPASHFYWGKKRGNDLRPTLEVLAFITAGMGGWES